MLSTATFHEAIDRSIRAKPLNARTREAMPAAVRVWDDQIAYLRHALEHREHPLSGRLRESFNTQLADLIRAREWLASKLVAEGVHLQENNRG